MKHISPTFMYIIPMYLRLTTFTKTFPQMSFHLYIFAIFISLWGSTHDSADCWTGALTDPRLPATASNVCTTDTRLGGLGRVPPPQTKILATPVGWDTDSPILTVCSRSRRKAAINRTMCACKFMVTSLPINGSWLVSLSILSECP